MCKHSGHGWYHSVRYLLVLPIHHCYIPSLQKHHQNYVTQEWAPGHWVIITLQRVTPTFLRACFIPPIPYQHAYVPVGPHQPLVSLVHPCAQLSPALPPVRQWRCQCCHQTKYKETGIVGSLSCCPGGGTPPWHARIPWLWNSCGNLDQDPHPISKPTHTAVPCLTGALH